MRSSIDRLPLRRLADQGHADTLVRRSRCLCDTLDATGTEMVAHGHAPTTAPARALYLDSVCPHSRLLRSTRMADIKPGRCELRFPLLVDLCCDAGSARGAWGWLGETGRAFRVVQRFQGLGLRFPSGPMTGRVWQLVWSAKPPPLGILKNPMRECMSSDVITVVVRRCHLGLAGLGVDSTRLG